jgi:hypothetical protein
MKIIKKLSVDQRAPPSCLSNAIKLTPNPYDSVEVQS